MNRELSLLRNAGSTRIIASSSERRRCQGRLAASAARFALTSASTEAFLARPGRAGRPTTECRRRGEMDKALFRVRKA
jgi:hypothetical protein